jgi:type IV secretory pathway TraG/TraD family ATPase VirD4
VGRVRVVSSLLLLGLLSLQGWTQYLGVTYGYAAVLGVPWWQGRVFARHHALYLPWKGLVWWWQWGSRASHRWAVRVSVALLLLVVVGCWWSVTHRRTNPPPMEGHGTGQWATRRDIRKAGLL